MNALEELRREIAAVMALVSIFAWAIMSTKGTERRNCANILRVDHL